MSRDWPTAAGTEPKAHALSQIIRASERLMRAEVRAQQQSEQKNRFAAAVSIVNHQRPTSSAIASRTLHFNNIGKDHLANEPIVRPFSPRLHTRPRSATRNNVLEKRPVDFTDRTYPNYHTNYIGHRSADEERYDHSERNSFPHDDPEMSQSLLMLEQYLHDERAKPYVHIPSRLHVEMEGSVLAAKSTASPSLHSLSRVLSPATKPAHLLTQHVQQYQPPPKLQRQSSYRSNNSKK